MRTLFHTFVLLALVLGAFVQRETTSAVRNLNAVTVGNTAHAVYRPHRPGSPARSFHHNPEPAADADLAPAHRGPSASAHAARLRASSARRF
jgi:hypothetical protein